MTRSQLLNRLADFIASVKRPHPLRVAIDGVDVAGKTVMADELVRPIEDRGRPVIRASVDGFHRPRSERYERGADSPEGYYYDSFDYEAVRSTLLGPLGPGGNRQYRRAVFDFRSDSPVCEPLKHAPVHSVLLFDGVFLLRPELSACWDYRVFVRVGFPVALRRVSHRDQLLLGSADAIRARFRTRYLPGQRIYLKTVRPQERADVVVENNDPANPGLLVVNPTCSRTDVTEPGMRQGE